MEALWQKGSRSVEEVSSIDTGRQSSDQHYHDHHARRNSRTITDRFVGGIHTLSIDNTSFKKRLQSFFRDNHYNRHDANSGTDISPSFSCPALQLLLHCSALLRRFFILSYLTGFSPILTFTDCPSSTASMQPLKRGSLW